MPGIFRPSNAPPSDLWICSWRSRWRSTCLLAIVVSSSPACGGDRTLDPCANAPSFAEDIKDQIVAVQCAQCHSDRLSGAARRGAPATFDFDTYERMFPNRIAFASAITSGLMPPLDLEPPSSTTKAERELVERWGLCDYPP